MEGMEAEKALRKLMSANKAGKAKAGHRIWSDSGVDGAGAGSVVKERERERREEVWREVLEAVRREDQRVGADGGDTGGGSGGAMFGLDGVGAGEAMEAGVEVDYDRMFARRGRT